MGATALLLGPSSFARFWALNRSAQRKTRCDRRTDIQRDILTGVAHRRRIRRVGNSNMVAPTRWRETLGFGAGVEVLVQETTGGELRIVGADAPNESMRDAATHLANRHRVTLDLLAGYGAPSTRTSSSTLTRSP